MKKIDLNDKKYDRLVSVLFVAILVIGLFLRFYQHFMGRSLWEDECHFALNFIKYDFWRLTKPLDDIQAGPIFFLWGVKAFVTVFGYNEIAFRSLTWLFSIITLPLMYYVTLELTKKRIVALLSFLVFSVNLSVLYFSSELKPYGIDVSVYLLITYLTVSSNSYIHKNRNKLLLIVGALSILFSNVSFILLFCSGCYMFSNWYDQKKIIKQDIPVLLVWASVFLINFFLFIYGHPATADQRQNYAFAFLPTEILSCDQTIFLKRRIDEIFFTMLLYFWKTWYFSWILFLAIVVSTVNALSRKNYVLLLFTWAPILLHLGLSAMHLYPFWFRLILYLVPAFIILVCHGIYLIAAFFGNRLSSIVGILFILFCLVFLTKENIRRFPMWPLEIKPALKFVNENVPPQMHIYMSTPINAYKYYTYRGYVKDTIYKAVPWTISPDEFYEFVSEEKSNYLFFYGSSYPEFGYKEVVEDLRKRKLIVKEIEYGGYIASIIKPLNVPEFLDSAYKVLRPAEFGHPQDYEQPIWSGSVTSQPITLPKGKYKFVVLSKGSSVKGIFPVCSFFVNDSKIGEFTSNYLYERSIPMDFDQSADGQVTIKINLDNDYSEGNEDRNAFIKKILIIKTE